MALGISGGEGGFADPTQPVQCGDSDVPVLSRQRLFDLGHRVVAAEEMRRHAHRDVRLSKDFAGKCQASRVGRLRICHRGMMTTARRLLLSGHQMLSQHPCRFAPAAQYPSADARQNLR
jgi:hypothetical protein